jgi:hypothetical protein
MSSHFIFFDDSSRTRRVELIELASIDAAMPAVAKAICMPASNQGESAL